MEDSGFCPVHESIELLQEKWVLHIIRSRLEGPSGFNALSRSVGGVNTTTLAQRLEQLERLRIIDKVIESTMPPKTRYELTDAGYELQGVIDSIDAWARKHIAQPLTNGGRIEVDAATV
jgi:DNA-binding HxlR family transcriptional regulator